jgi:hypothetical protein
MGRAMSGGYQHGGFTRGGRPFSKYRGTDARSKSGRMPNTPEQASWYAGDAFNQLSDDDALEWFAKNEPAGYAAFMDGGEIAPMGEQQGATPTHGLPVTRPDTWHPTASRQRMGPAEASAASQQALGQRQAAAKMAVRDTRIQQVTNPGETVDRIRTVQEAERNQMGITDLGGGTKAMSNKYGTGFAKRMTAEEYATRAPGVIRDEKGTVDTAALMAAAASGGAPTVPYKPGPGQGFPSLTAGEARPQVQQQIASGITAAAPGAPARLAQDKAAMVQSYTQQTAPARMAAEAFLARHVGPQAADAKSATPAAPKLPVTRPQSAPKPVAIAYAPSVKPHQPSSPQTALGAKGPYFEAQTMTGTTPNVVAQAPMPVSPAPAAPAPAATPKYNVASRGGGTLRLPPKQAPAPPVTKPLYFSGGRTGNLPKRPVTQD